MAIFSKACKPDNFESHNSLTLCFTNICEILAVCETDLWEDSYAWSWSLCEGRTSFYMTHISRKLCRFFLIFLNSFASFSILINPSTNVFVFGDFNEHHKDWLIYSDGTYRSGELWMTLLRLLTFLLGFQTVIPTVLLFWITLFLPMLVFILQWLSLHWEILLMLLSQFPLTFHYIHKGMTCFIALLMTIADWCGVWDHLRVVPWEDIFKLSASAAASEFCGWVQVGIDIPHRKYQVKPHSSPWFSAACAAAIVHRNHFFHLYQKDKSSDSKVKFKQASNCCKRILEAAKLANKTKEFITSQGLGSWDFWPIATSVLDKEKSSIPPLLNGPEVLSSAFDKAKLFA